MSRRRPQKTLCLLTIIAGVFLFCVLDANAATLNVPQDYPSIQAGIDAAQEGDTVLVAPATYAGCIALHLKSNVR
ncbi:MAG: hypothetical protein ACLQVJ_15130 [Syntrophobacteraceae bacterium]